MPGFEILQYDPPRSYARASRVGELVFIAGETGTDHHSGAVDNGIVAQAERAFDNLEVDLATCGLDLSSLVQMDVFLVDRANVRPFMEVLRRRLPGGTAPPGALVLVAGLIHEGALLEIECVAAAKAAPAREAQAQE